MNARLYQAPAPRKPATPGRPRKRGARLPTPAQMLGQRGHRLELKLYAYQQRSRVVDTLPQNLVDRLLSAALATG